MRKANKLRGLVSGILAAAMVMSMSGMTAWADSTNNTVNDITLTKKVLTDGNTYAPDETFTITVTPADGGTITKDGSSYVVYTGETGGVYADPTNSFAFAAGNAAQAEYTQDGTIKTDVRKFTKAGIYHYQVSETKPESGYEGIDYDETVYDLYAYVEKNDKGVLSIKAITVGTDKVLSSEKNDDGTDKEGKAGKIEFVNHYGDSSANTDKIHDLTITKSVTGSQGDLNKAFTFTISVTSGANKNEKYKAILTHKDSTTSTTNEYTFVSGMSQNIGLKDNESIQIYGLSDSDIVTVYEASYSDDGYTTTIASNNNKEGVTYFNDYSTAKVAEINVDQVSTKVVKDGAEITFTNDKDVATPTGIILTFAPYALMVALAGVIAVMFLRKKREEEY